MKPGSLIHGRTLLSAYQAALNMKMIAASSVVDVLLFLLEKKFMLKQRGLIEGSSDVDIIGLKFSIKRFMHWFVIRPKEDVT